MRLYVALGTLAGLLLACASGEVPETDEESGGGPSSSSSAGGHVGGSGGSSTSAGGSTSSSGDAGGAGASGGSGGLGGGTGGVGGDTDPPTVVSIAPDDGATAVIADTDVVIQFSEPMDQANVAAALVTTSLGTVALSWNGAGDTLTIDPTVDLAYAQDVNPPTVAALSFALSVGTGGGHRSRRQSPRRGLRRDLLDGARDLARPHPRPHPLRRDPRGRRHQRLLQRRRLRRRQRLAPQRAVQRLSVFLAVGSERQRHRLHQRHPRHAAVGDLQRALWRAGEPQPGARELRDL